MKESNKNKKFEHRDIGFSEEFLDKGTPTKEDIDNVPLIDSETAEQRRIREKLMKSVQGKWARK